MGRPRSPLGRARETDERLALLYPGSAVELCALAHSGPFELLVATILSAQCTDERVNRTTPALFARFPTAEALASADAAEVEALIRPTGFFRTKARNLVAMATVLVERFDGRVPEDLTELVTLPGVGRKTANVLRSVAFGLPGLPVDTHVLRVSRRLGLSERSDPVGVEFDLDRLVPARMRGVFSLRLIQHGRTTCRARRPRCRECALGDFCPSASVAEACNRCDPPPRAR
ncbi:MAG: endonuclease III [Acidimicrobiales bacterium]